jgi:nucleoside-diphosphate-sugar epimerase
MKVFITGVTGYIGYNVALAFRRAGYHVAGLIRNPKKAWMLESNEIHPVLGDLHKPETYMDAVKGSSLIVHAAADYSTDRAAVDRRVLQTVMSAKEEEPRPKTFIYTSGCWVYGNTGAAAADEATPLNPSNAVRWRPAVEQEVLSASGLRTVVVRPGCVYGKRGGLMSIWFDGVVHKNDLRVVGDGSNRWSLVHVDDLAEVYVRIAEREVTGSIFNVADGSQQTVGEMAQAVARAAGYAGVITYVPVEEATTTLGPLAESLALDQHLDARKATEQLGWHPRHNGFAGDAETYLMAWKSASS